MTETNDSLVQFTEVQKSYDGESLVVKDLNLSVVRGEFLTLLGPSGSGKTTTLMMLAGFEVPTHGTITLDGRTLDKVPPHKRGIGIVFQNYALFPHMSVEENVAFPLGVRKISKDETERKVMRALEMVQLSEFRKRWPAQLSGGQQQRVALARALVFEPQLVLMDEPLGALDRKLREMMQLEIKHIHESLGVTVVYVTHDQGEALTMSDRIAVFHEGVIQQIDTPSGLYERPKNSFVARFIGENNTFDGTVESIDGAECRVRLDTGELVVAKPVSVEGPGTRTTLSIRPERMSIGDGGDGPNRFDAQVTELIYLGDHVQLCLKLAQEHDFMVKLPVASFTPGLGPGDRIAVSWRVADCRALDPV